MDGTVWTRWARETITVVARTYPECSKKYGCLVCTAGINSRGEWRRLYPIPWALFWGKSTKGSHGKWDIISVPTRKAVKDQRPESYEVDATTIQDDLRVEGRLDGWDERRRLLAPFLDPNLEGLWGGDRSLALVKPREVADFFMQERHRIRDPDEELTLEKTEQAQQILQANGNLRLSGKVAPFPRHFRG